MPQPFPPITELVPQTGDMCLLEAILSHDESSVACSASSHRSERNPLRCDGRLPAMAAIEYGAQAVAVHGGLQPVKPARDGVLAGVRAVRCHVRYLDEEPGHLIVRAERLVANGSRLLYSFSVEGAKSVLVSGRVAVVLATPGSNK